jgi:hypothetical protein
MNAWIKTTQAPMNADPTPIAAEELNAISKVRRAVDLGT